MKETAVLTATSLLSILFVTFHLADDIVFKMAPAGLQNLVAVVILASTSGPATSRQLACDGAFDPGVAWTDLVRRFGNANVSTEDLEGGGAEGDTEPTTVLFAKQPADRVEIHWTDKSGRRSPSLVVIHGTRSRWSTPGGLTLGIHLRRLELLNRRPFRLAGFGFDGEGAVLSWADGALEEADTGRCWTFVRLGADWPADADGQKVYRQVLGDRNFSSAHPAMRALDPTIREIALVYTPRPKL